MKMLLKKLPTVLLLATIALLLEQNIALRQRPSIEKMVSNKDHQFFVVFESGDKKYAVVAPMIQGNRFGKPFLIKVDQDVPVSSNDIHKTFGYLDDTGIFKLE